MYNQVNNNPRNNICLLYIQSIFLSTTIVICWVVLITHLCLTGDTSDIIKMFLLLLVLGTMLIITFIQYTFRHIPEIRNNNVIV